MACVLVFIFISRIGGLVLVKAYGWADPQVSLSGVVIVQLYRQY